jgi:hypothetical protein
MTKNNIMSYDPPVESQQQNETAISIEQTRAMQQVQAAVIMAKKFPRDENAAFARIMQSCKRISLAKIANYSYPRGDTQVSGPTIHLAKSIAKAWCNMDFGIVELSQQNGSSEVLAYCWDLETNVQEKRQFAVKHVRYSKSGGIQKLTEPRDIYEVAANNGARRLRACILGIVPNDVVEAAVKECRKTLAGDNSEPISDKIRRCVAQFSELSVSQEMIEARLGHKMEATTREELIDLGEIFNSLKDKIGKVEDYFEKPKAEKPVATEEEGQEINERQQKLFEGKR